VTYNAADQSGTLMDLLRLQTRPLAVKLLSPEENLPKRVHRPKRLLKHRITICQGITMARRYGWRLGLLKDDVCCAAALIAYGWAGKQPRAEEVADLMLAAQYAQNREAAHRQIEAIPRLAPGECSGLVLSPLELTTWKPDLVMIYASPGQMMRLVQAATYHEGIPLTAYFGGKAASCAEGIIRTFQTQQCQIVLPCGGDRIFAMTADDELAFVAPEHRIDQLLEGLRLAGRGAGMAYPIPVYQGFEPRFPPAYNKLFEQIT
jgi:uncharacterized protein (DUF169 family)